MSKKVALLVLNRGAKLYPEGRKLEKEATTERGKIKSRGENNLAPPWLKRLLSANILLKRLAYCKSEGKILKSPLISKRQLICKNIYEREIYEIPSHLLKDNNALILLTRGENDEIPSLI